MHVRRSTTNERMDACLVNQTSDLDMDDRKQLYFIWPTHHTYYYTHLLTVQKLETNLEQFFTQQSIFALFLSFSYTSTAFLVEFGVPVIFLRLVPPTPDDGGGESPSERIYRGATFHLAKQYVSLCRWSSSLSFFLSFSHSLPRFRQQKKKRSNLGQLFLLLFVSVGAPFTDFSNWIKSGNYPFQDRSKWEKSIF